MSELDNEAETPISPETLEGIRIANRTIAHFFGNPLQPIKGGAEILLEDSSLTADQKELVEEIATHAKQLEDRMLRLQAQAKTGEIKIINGPVGTYIDLNEPKK